MPIRKPRPTTASPAGASSPTAAAAWRVGLLLSFLRLRFRLVVIAALVALAGCEKDGIQHYQAPKPPVYRLLGAIVPHGEYFWFFKVTGPDDAVREHKKEFGAFLDSLTFAVDKPPTWNLPAGWREGEADKMRVATLLIGPGDEPLELTVTRFPRDPATQDEVLLKNVNRWRDQMGVAPVEADRLAEVAPPRDLHGVTARLMDMVGPKPGKTRRAPMMPDVHPGPRPEDLPREEPAARPGLRYTLPDGWKEVPPSRQLAVAEFQVRDDGAEALVTVTPLKGDGGDLLANVNRWRSDQLGLPRIDEDQLRRDLASLPAAGDRAEYVDLVGPRQRMLVAIVRQKGSSWFFKMMGPTDLVGRQKAAFEAFMKSVRFE